jgi:hypothetical protein
VKSTNNEAPHTNIQNFGGNLKGSNLMEDVGILLQNPRRKYLVVTGQGTLIARELEDKVHVKCLIFFNLSNEILTEGLPFHLFIF